MDENMRTMAELSILGWTGFLLLPIACEALILRLVFRYPLRWMLGTLAIANVLNWGLCFVVYRYFGQQILLLNLKLDDGRGYFLICVLLITFFSSALAYYVGGLLGYDQDPAQQGRLVGVILLNAIVALVALTYGLMHFKEGERY